jgi:hypothetical protein
MGVAMELGGMLTGAVAVWGACLVAAIVAKVVQVVLDRVEGPRPAPPVAAPAPAPAPPAPAPAAPGHPAGIVVAGTGVDPVTSRFSGARSAN